MAKKEKTIEKEDCKHDWAYNSSWWASIRKCVKCGRLENKDWIDQTHASGWYLKL